MIPSLKRRCETRLIAGAGKIAAMCSYTWDLLAIWSLDAGNSALDDFSCQRVSLRQADEITIQYRSTTTPYMMRAVRPPCKPDDDQAGRPKPSVNSVSRGLRTRGRESSCEIASNNLVLHGAGGRIVISRGPLPSRRSIDLLYGFSARVPGQLPRWLLRRSRWSASTPRKLWSEAIPRECSTHCQRRRSP